MQAERALFISDLHLSPNRPATADLFEAFLRQISQEDAPLFILGDLFDYWAGDDDIADPFNARICAALLALPQAHFLVRGNRDLLLSTGFAAASGCQLLADESVHHIAGVPTLLLHGDTLCTDDVAYQDFRRTVHSEKWQSGFLALPLSERRRQIEALRRQSETSKQDKADYLMDTNRDAVAAAFHQHDVKRIIHGHTHRLAQHHEAQAGPDCERFVLGEWHDNGNFLRCTAEGWRYEYLSSL